MLLQTDMWFLTFHVTCMHHVCLASVLAASSDLVSAAYHASILCEVVNVSRTVQRKPSQEHVEWHLQGQLSGSTLT